MNEISISQIIQYVIQFVIYALTIGISYGMISQKIANLNEKFDDLKTKVEKHNQFMERIAILEERSKSNTHRLDRLDKLENSDKP